MSSLEHRTEQGEVRIPEDAVVFESYRPTLYKFYSRTPGPLNVLSNFHEGPVTVNGRTYPSGEACFHGEKFRCAAKAAETPERAAQIVAHALKLHGVDPRTAKQLGSRKAFALKPAEMAAWDAGVAEETQVLICKQKLLVPLVAEVLRSHDGNFLHQDNRAKANTPWGGRVDKTGAVVGQNKLGKIWDRVKRQRVE